MLDLKQISDKYFVVIFLALTVFTLPLSNSLKSIFLVLSVFAILASQDSLVNFRRVLRQAWCQLLLLLFALILLACLYSGADWHSKINVVNKYTKLLYLPLLAIAFQDKSKRAVVVPAFLSAMLITCCLSFLKKMAWIHMSPEGDAGAVFHNHIDTGLFMAFAAYLAASSACKTQGSWRAIYLFLTGLFSVHTLFVNTGRTGYLVFALLVLVFLIQTVSWKKGFSLVLLALPLMALIAFQSPTMKHGLSLAWQESQAFEHGVQNTSVGFRLQFAHYAHKLFSAKPLLGWGTAGFTHQFSLEQPIPAWGKHLSDPHNQYWLFMVDYGLFGLLLFLLFLITVFLAARKEHETYPITLGLLSLFLLANCFDSFLLLSNGGYLFILFASLGLGESLALSPVLANKNIPPLIEVPC